MGTQPSLTPGSEPGSELRYWRGPPEVNGEGKNDLTQREKEKQNQDNEIRMKDTNLFKKVIERLHTDVHWRSRPRPPAHPVL